MGARLTGSLRIPALSLALDTADDNWSRSLSRQIDIECNGWAACAANKYLKARRSGTRNVSFLCLIDGPGTAPGVDRELEDNVCRCTPDRYDTVMVVGTVQGTDDQLRSAGKQRSLSTRVDRHPLPYFERRGETEIGIRRHGFGRIICRFGHWIGERGPGFERIGNRRKKGLVCNCHRFTEVLISTPQRLSQEKQSLWQNETSVGRRT